MKRNYNSVQPFLTSFHLFSYSMFSIKFLSNYNHNSANTCLFKFNSRDTKERCEICSKLTIKTPQRRQWRRSGVVIVKFENVSHLSLVFLLLLWTCKCLLRNVIQMIGISKEKRMKLMTFTIHWIHSTKI